MILRAGTRALYARLCRMCVSVCVCVWLARRPQVPSWIEKANMIVCAGHRYTHAQTHTHTYQTCAQHCTLVICDLSFA